MQRFFLPGIKDDVFSLPEELSRHIARSLRMKEGDRVIICDGRGNDLSCEIISTSQLVTVKVISKSLNTTEPSIKVKLYQALPKGDKFSFIVQKAVELGVSEIIPVLSSRCVARPDQKAMAKKVERYNKIALEAAQQSGRGKVPEVKDMISFREAVLKEKGKESILFYECATNSLSAAIKKDIEEISIFVGSEGGFEPSEVEFAEENHIKILSLGKRILRCETAPIAALSVIMYETGNLDF